MDLTTSQRQTVGKIVLQKGDFNNQNNNEDCTTKQTRWNHVQKLAGRFFVHL